ncbi:MAG: hypothetical protein C4576_21585 [Desulfobacteraceae bacterium]|nr:MAG: hypothetical protein C4576_21585 [Desulfobacteraceae bacterium]
MGSIGISSDGAIAWNGESQGVRDLHRKNVLSKIILMYFLAGFAASGFRLKDCRNDGLWSLFVIPAVFKPESRSIERHRIYAAPGGRLMARTSRVLEQRVVFCTIRRRDLHKSSRL